jgi:hypothetical protein
MLLNAAVTRFALPTSAFSGAGDALSSRVGAAGWYRRDARDPVRSGVPMSGNLFAWESGYAVHSVGLSEWAILSRDPMHREDSRVVGG